MTDLQKIETILTHIKKVESNLQKLAKHYIDEEKEFALELLQRSRSHDLSKFSLFEFENLWKENEEFEEALYQHRTKNKHHVEYHTNIHFMNEVDLAELTCDCFARSNEFGTDIKQWFENEATIRYNFKMDDEVGRMIKIYLEILLTPAFS